jgi:hypothetical protein
VETVAKREDGRAVMVRNLLQETKKEQSNETKVGK